MLNSISIRFVLVVGALFGLAADLGATPQDSARTAPWSDEVLDLAARLPIQDGGRLKPLDTFASFTLLRFNGKRSLETVDGERLSALEWLLDTLFYPEFASDQPLFLVQNSEVIAAIGMSIEGKRKRDRYSLNELRGSVPRLFELAREYSQIEEKERSTVQQQLYLLALNVDAYLQLFSCMDFARTPLPLTGERLVTILGQKAQVRFSEVVQNMPALRDAYGQLAQAVSAEERDELAALGRVLQGASELTTGTQALAMIPPSSGDQAEWLSVYDVFAGSVEGSSTEEQAVLLTRFEGLVASLDDPAAFTAEMRGLHDQVTTAAKARGEYDQIDLEVSYYRWKLLDWSQYLFVGAFLLIAFVWLRPRNRWLYRVAAAVAVVGTGYLIAGITMRCIIRGRPPVSTLYETVLFVTAVGALASLVLEGINRQKIALSAAAIVGVIGLFVANGYEILDKRDTMPSLVAVLDTNFWLATHVTCITIGYSAGMLAALLASSYLLLKPIRRVGADFLANIARMVYGVLCFGLLFSIVGTILGGIWANDSWGRFWGWDPKENGALLIVLSQILILHGRMGGYLREHGVCMAAAFGGTVIAFSWWGVNLLGVGLHSYGFTSGIHQALWTYYLIQWGIVGIGAVTWFVQGRGARLALPGSVSLGEDEAES